jgi:two-component sensor histidine kinase
LTEFERQFTRQMNALGRVQNLISATDYGNVEVGALVRDELYALHEEQLQSSGRVLLEGPTVLLSASAAQAIGLAIHELATNAVKYGALGQDNGQLRVEWRMEDRKRSPWLVLSWKESGLTLSAENPVRTGYGRELIERALPYQLGAETHFALEPDGVRCRICVRLQDERPA